MSEFIIGDIVKLKKNGKVLYIVVDIANFFEKTDEKKIVADIDYELMQIYPIQKNSTYTVVNQNEITIHAEVDTKDNDLILRFVQKDREKMGWYGLPDFAQVILHNMRTVSMKDENERVDNMEEKGRLGKKYDSIRYDLIETVDECLDAINDLSTLHKMFGDEAYLQLIEMVLMRLEKLHTK